MWSDNLPSPVQKYFQKVLPPHFPLIKQAICSQEGQARTSLHSKRWMPFTANQLVEPVATSFKWSADIRLIPFIHLKVVDSFQQGFGRSHVGVGPFVLDAAGDTPQMNLGSMHRYLAEAVWYPTALLPQSGVKWEPVNDQRARASLSYQGQSVELDFIFDEHHLVSGIFTSVRWGKFGKEFKLTPWEGHFREYKKHQGFLIPEYGEVGWYEGSSWEKVWWGRIKDLQFIFE